MTLSELYQVIELPDTPEGKFGGYLVRPSYIKTNRIPRIIPLNIQLKYDNNKLLDSMPSNNGI